VSGGIANQATSPFGAVSGGMSNVAGEGTPHEAHGDLPRGAASVCGGRGNQARAETSAISGGANLSVAVTDGWAAGSLGDGGPFSGRHRSE